MNVGLTDYWPSKDSVLALLSLALAVNHVALRTHC